MSKRYQLEWKVVYGLALSNQAKKESLVQFKVVFHDLIKLDFLHSLESIVVSFPFKPD